MVGETSPRRYPILGDIVVTKVTDRYAIVRVQGEGTPWASIQTSETQSAALSLACHLITGSERVFLYARDGLLHRIVNDCAHPFWLP